MSRRVLQFSFFVSITALCAVPIRAQVLFVDDSAPPGGDGSSWALALDDLGSALESAALADVQQVWVAEGRYVPSPTDPTVSFVLPDGVLVYGGFAGTETSLEQRDPAAHPTVLDGDLKGDDQPSCGGRTDNSEQVVTDAGGASSHLDGFTVRGGHVGPGAGLFLTADHVTLAQLIIEQNCDPDGIVFGGGAQTMSPFVVVEDCIFRDNDGNGGGGMRMSSPREAFFSNCLFERNTKSGVLFHGALVGQVRFRDCWFLDTENSGISMAAEAFMSLEIDGCTFERNVANTGGGISVSTESGGTVAIHNSVFRANEATTGAGVSFRESISVASISCRVSDSVFEDNRGCAGGGIFTNTGPTVVERCVFRNNHFISTCGMGRGGGGIRADLDEASVEVSSSSFSQSEGSLLWAGQGAQVHAELCTFSNAGTSVPAIRLTGTSSVELASCIVWGDAASQVQTVATATVSAVFSDVRQGGAGLPGTGNFEADPLFVDATGHDLRLMPGSPCIEAGDPIVLPPGPDAGRYSRLTDGDLDRVARVDMGGHEASPIELAITGTPAPGSTLTIETSGQPGLTAFLAIDRPGQHFFPQWGTLFLSLTGGFLSDWPSAPSTTTVSVPPGLAGLFQAQAIVLESGAIAFSNYVPLSF